MSYLGLVRPVVKGYLSCFDTSKKKLKPVILEIGVDKGQTTIPLVQNLVNNFDSFVYIGVDIKLNEEFANQIMQFSGINIKYEGRTQAESESDKHVILITANSLDYLKRTENMRYDVVFLDGDHNYTTVINELKLLENNTHENSIIVCDDYMGRWSMQDLFYSDRKEYKDNELATARNDKTVIEGKKGVKTAVDDFIEYSKYNWDLLPTNTEPCILSRGKDHKLKFTQTIVGRGYMRDVRLLPIVNKSSKDNV